MSRLRSATALVALFVLAALLGLTGCGSEPALSACGVVVDGSESADLLTQKTRPRVERFVAESRCATVRVVVISANSVGETCTAPRLDLAGSMIADPSNESAWSQEYEREQAPRITAVAARLVKCVAARGTAGGTDVYGALTELARTELGGLRVLISSDMINTVDSDLRNELLRSADDRAKVIAAAAARDRVPEMKGWDVDATGAAYGTTGMGPDWSADLQRYWAELFAAKGAQYRALAS